MSHVATAIIAVSLTTIALLLGGANWPSTSGTTARGIVLEDGAGNVLGTAANPLRCQ